MFHRELNFAVANVLYSSGHKDKYSSLAFMNRIGEVVQSTCYGRIPDIFMFQEVPDANKDEFAARFGDMRIFQLGEKPDGGKSKPMSLITLISPTILAEQIQVPEINNALAVVIDWDGKEVLLVNVHVPMNNEERRGFCESLSGIPSLRIKEREHVLIAGDFNSFPDDEDGYGTVQIQNLALASGCKIVSENAIYASNKQPALKSFYPFANDLPRTPLAARNTKGKLDHVLGKGFELKSEFVLNNTSKLPDEIWNQFKSEYKDNALDSVLWQMASDHTPQLFTICMSQK
jgi:endonuclease/exonuclease/phosphatase family metal-dependent hydrolase